MIHDKLTLDSVRETDANGYMHVAVSNLTKEQVAPYTGRSIPDWETRGLEPDKIYNIFRPREELEKAAETFNGLPLMLDHWDFDANNVPKDKIIGSLGTDARYEHPYLKNSLTIIDSNAIGLIVSGAVKELSAGYTCTIDMNGGMYDGVAYDGVMRDIKGNHVALVQEGRAGHDVKVADSKGGAIMEGIETIKNAMREVINEMRGKKTEPTQDEPAQDEGVQPTVAQDEDIDELMRQANLDPEDEGAKAAFMAGVLAGKAAVTDEDNVADEGEEVADECGAKDEQVADECGTKDEEGAKVGDSAIHDKAFYAGLYKAAEEVAPYIGKINNPFMFDSAADIYKKALIKQGIKLDGVEPSAYGAMVSMLSKPQSVADSKEQVTADPLNAVLSNIKVR